MMKNTLSVVTLLAAGVSHAAGFSIDTHSARATGMGTASVAAIDDSSAIAYNAANILGVKKLDITVGDTPIIPRLSFTREGGEKQTFKNTVSPPPHAFAVYRINETMAAGVGVFVPFGAGAFWPDDFVGRTRGYKSQLATYFINPTFAIQPNERFRLGVGLDIARGTVAITRKLDLVEQEGAIELGGGGWGVGYNAGIQLALVPNLVEFGAQFRSPTKMKFTGHGDFQNIPVEFQSTLKDQPLESTVTLPGSVALGLKVTPIERLTVAFDLNQVLWSSFRTFTIEFEDPALTNPLPKNWRNTWNYHLGAEYGVTDALDVRLGFVADPSPSPNDTLTPDLPDADRYKVTVGAGYDFNPIRVDVGYQFTTLTDKVSTAPGIQGVYSGNGHVLALTLGYSM